MGVTINPENPKIGGLPIALGITAAGMKKVMIKLSKCIDNTDPTLSSSKILLSVLKSKWTATEKIYFSYMYGMVVEQNLPFLSIDDATNQISSGFGGWPLPDAIAILQSLVITMIANYPGVSQTEKESLIMGYSDYLARIACDENHNFGRVKA